MRVERFVGEIESRGPLKPGEIPGKGIGRRASCAGGVDKNVRLGDGLRLRGACDCKVRLPQGFCLVRGTQTRRMKKS